MIAFLGIITGAIAPIHCANASTVNGSWSSPTIVLGVFGGMLCAVGSAHAEVTLTNLGVLGTVGSNYSSAVSTNSDGSVIVG